MLVAVLVWSCTSKTVFVSCESLEIRVSTVTDSEEISLSVSVPQKFSNKETIREVTSTEIDSFLFKIVQRVTRRYSAELQTAKQTFTT